ncbi:MAG: MotA/TolQ/ExbB proton channel family protein [Aquabacterium sp.]
MDGLTQFWTASDAIGRSVALLLLAMSVACWVLILWKGWVLQRARRDGPRAIAAFWSAPTPQVGRERLALLDREQTVTPLFDAALSRSADDTLETQGSLASQLTRRLRDALLRATAHLQLGQVVLASIGATAPFVGLFGTVWGIYHALLSISAAGSITIEKVSGPVGEALVMTAAGLAVAIPAVLAYNLFGKWIAGCEAELEGFAHDLREMALEAAAPPGPTG